MAASFANASSTRISNAASPIPSTPFSVGFWFNIPTSATTRVLFSNADTAVANNYWIIFKSTTNLMTVGCADSITSQNVAIASAIASSAWGYAVMRAISATNRRLSILHASGLVEHAQSTFSLSPTSVDTISLGGRITSAPDLFMDGSVAEFWCTNTDIQADGAQTQDALVRQLAYGGPFSIPHIAKDILEYRSLRKYPSSEGDEAGEVFHGAGRQTWSNVNGVTIGAHPPLPYWYARPPSVADTTRRNALLFDEMLRPPGGFFSRYYYDMGRVNV